MLVETIAPIQNIFTDPSGEFIGYIMVSLISFLLGLIAGYSLSVNISGLDETTVRRIIALVLLSIYVVSVLSEIWIVRYETPMLLHSVVGGAIGYLISKGEGSVINISALNQDQGNN
jgi:hypothetical protein